MKKRILSMFLTLLMVVSVLPVNVMAATSGTASEVMENANQSDGIILRKSAQAKADGSVDVSIEAYTTGLVSQTTVAKPTDIVLVLDMSGSMNTTVASTTSTWTYSAVYGEREWDWGYYYGHFNTNSSSTKYYVLVDGTYREVALVDDDSNGYYYYRYYDSSNNAVYVYPIMENSNRDNDQVNSYPVVQFYRGRNTTQTINAITALKRAVAAFIETTRTKNAEIAAQGLSTDSMHRIAIVKFADDSYYNASNLLQEGNNKGAGGDSDYNYTELVKNLTVVDSTGASTLTTSVNSLQPGGATAVDYGMNVAKAVLAQTPSNRNKVVIVFSDGEPNHSSGFNSTVANTAIGIANGLKLANTKVYSLSMASGSNPADTTSDLNKFFHYMSSNYPSAQNLSTPGANGNPNAGYYYAPTFDLSLTQIFESIAQQIETPTISLDETTQIVDTASAYFTIPNGTSSITVQTADRIHTTDGWDWSTPAASGLTPIVSGKTVQVSGFNFDENFISDTPRTKGSNSSYYGTKLILTINVLPDYSAIDGKTFTDGKIPTNDGTANVTKATGIVASVASPTVTANTVTYKYTVNGANETTHATYYRLPGAAVTQLGAITRTGYTFSGWSTSDVTVTGGSFTMPQGNVVFTGNFVANTHDITYTITGHNPGVTIPSDYNQTGVAYGTTVTVKPDLSLTGYTFTGWKSDAPVVGVGDANFSMPDHDVKLYGFFEPMSGVSYTTIHYTQNLDGTYSRAEDPIVRSGTTGDTVTAAPRTYTGFTRDDSVTGAVVTGEGTFNAAVSGQIAGDGSLVLRVFHKRNQYTVTYAYDGSYPTAAASLLPATETFYHGQTVTIKGHAEQEAIPDHTFTGWHTASGAAVTVGDTDASFTMPIGNVTLWGEFAKKTDVAFKIEHYLQDGSNWKLEVTDTSHATAGTVVKDDTYQRTFTGYTYASGAVDNKTEGTVSEAPALVLKLYYTINKYKVTYRIEGDAHGATIPADYNQANVAYGTTVTVKDALTALGYTFSGWEIESPASTVIDGTTFTMPASDVVLVGSFHADTDTKYRIEYYWQNIDNDNYSLHEGHDRYGTTGATVSIPELSYPGFTLDKTVTGTLASGAILANGELVLKLFYNRNTYKVQYKYEAGVPSNAPDLPTDDKSYRYGQTVKVANDVSMEHYQFIGWYSKQNGTVTGEITEFEMPIPYDGKTVTLYGDFQQITGVTFKVHHYLQDAVNSTDYTLKEIDTITTGVAGETATGRWNNYTGYTRNEGKSTISGTIKADNSLELHLYYDLVEYDVVYVIDGVNPGATVPVSHKAIYNQNVTVADDLSYTGYTFTGWTSADPVITADQENFSMPAKTVTLVGSFSKYPTYKVEYYKQNKTDLTKYDLDTVNSHSHSAPTDTPVEAHIHAYEGYTENTTHAERKISGNVAADSSLVLKVFYDLIPYTVEFKYEGTAPTGAPVLPATATNKYVGDSIPTPSVSVAGYSFDGWKSEQLSAVVTPGQDFTMPAQNVVLTGKFTAGNANYTVEHYLMNDMGSYDGVTPYTETKSGLVGDNVRATSYQPYLDLGAVLDTEKIWQNEQNNVSYYTGTIKADNSLVLKLYYSRKPAATVVYHYEGTAEQIAAWPTLPTDGTKYYVGATVTAKATAQPTNPNLTFEGWYAHEPQLHVQPGSTFQMPRMEGTDPVLHLYGRWVDNSPKTFTVKYFIDNIEQTAWTVTYPVGNDVQIRAKVADTAQYTYSVWSAPVSATAGVAVSITAGGFTMNAPGEVHIKCTSQKVIVPVKTYTVTYYIDGMEYWKQAYEAGQQHIMLGTPTLALGQFFSGWSAPRTTSGAIVSLFSLGNDLYGFNMPAADVVIHASTSWMPIPDGALKIKKVVESPADFTGGNVYTFNIYRLENKVKTLVHVEHVIVNPTTGKGESKYIELPKGTNYIVEEVGANVPGYALETVLRSETGMVIEPDQTIRVTMKLDPTVITFTNTYTEIPLETTDHFGYIIGYPDGTVRPEGDITRAEVATIFFRLLTDEKRAEYWAQTNSFTDVAADAWYNNAISTLANAGILEGYGDGTYRPGNAITRAELVKIAMSFYGKVDAESGAFNDTDEHWASAFINAAAELGFINGYGDGTFQPNRLVTRAEAMKIINRTLDRSPDKDHLLPDMIIWVDNADPDVWYYAEVQEATNSHTYIDGGLHEIWETILPIRNWAELERAWSEANDGKN